MVKKSLKDLDLGIIELKKTHQKEDEDLKRKYNDPKEAFEILSKQYEKVLSNPPVKVAVEMNNECGENFVHGRDFKKHLKSEDIL